LRGSGSRGRTQELVVFTALSLAVLWLTTFPPSSEAATRGLTLEIKVSEAPNAPTVETVNQYTQSLPLMTGIKDHRREGILLDVIAPPSAKSPVGVDHGDTVAGAVFKDCIVCPEMVVVPPGEFMMGGAPDEHEWFIGETTNGQNRFSREKPRHKVTIRKKFAVSKYEVKRGQYAKFVSATGRDQGIHCHVFDVGLWWYTASKNWRSPGFEQTEDHPVVCVNLDDAKAYAKWLSDKTGFNYRLLSESEWEYAAGAGTTTMRPWGNDWENQTGCMHANVRDAENNWRGYAKSFDCSDDYKYTAPTGRFLPTEFGLHDIYGNVSEWVQDCWHDSYTNAPDDGSSWNSGDCGLGITRGGSWYFSAKAVRSANRVKEPSDIRASFIGFRVAKTLPQ
jgi:formylglycine-generating enzyme required for sulfatase activity